MRDKIKQKEYNKKYWEKNKDKYYKNKIEYNKEYYRLNREELKKIQRDYYFNVEKGKRVSLVLDKKVWKVLGKMKKLRKTTYNKYLAYLLKKDYKEYKKVNPKEIMPPLQSS